MTTTEQADRDRAALQDSVAKALHQLDGSPAAAVALLTGMTRAEIDELGGFPTPTHQTSKEQR